MLLHGGDNLSCLLDCLQRLVCVYADTCATEGMDSDSFGETKWSGNIVAGSGIILGLKITGHWKIVVFSNLKIVGVHPVDGSLPVSS